MFDDIWIRLDCSKADFEAENYEYELRRELLYGAHMEVSKMGNWVDYTTANKDRVFISFVEGWTEIYVHAASAEFFFRMLAWACTTVPRRWWGYVESPTIEWWQLPEVPFWSLIQEGMPASTEALAGYRVATSRHHW